VQDFVDGVAGKRDADLVVLRRETSLHAAEIAGAPANVDEERVDHGIDVAGLADTGIVAETKCRKERFGHEEDAVENPECALADIFAGLVGSVGRNANDRADFTLTRRIDERADALEEIARCGGMLNDALSDGGDEVDVQHIAQCVVAEENTGVSGDDAVDDTFLHVTDYTGDDFAERDVILAGRAGEDAGLVGAKVKTSEHGFAGGFDRPDR